MPSANIIAYALAIEQPRIITFVEIRYVTVTKDIAI